MDKFLDVLFKITVFLAVTGVPTMLVQLYLFRN
jgi:hypothetical protein